ncbi:MAG: Crp/Fnr family transcriptional regulator [Mesorhizobium sp.]|nr:Crp/Fnr family transcriptional regulator [Mesorhizobium sp.]
MKRSARPTRPRVGQLAGALFDDLFAGCVAERFDAGKTLFLQDDPSERLFGVVSGSVEISHYSAGGRKLVANIETSRSIVGEIGALDGGKRTATATCLTDCELFSITRTQLHERIGRNPLLAQAIIGLLCARLRWVSSEFGDQVLLKVEARMAKRLLFLSDLLSTRDGWIAISQAELAEFLGTTRESVNKTMRVWRDLKVVEARRGAIRIADQAWLEEAATAG